MQTIVWDVDDVLNDLMRNWFELQWLPEHHFCRVSYADLIHNPPHEILDISLNEYLRSLDAFRFSEQGRQLLPNTEIMSWFQIQGCRFRHVALTSTPVLNAPYSAAWVFRHFGAWIRTFAFVPSRRETDPEFVYDDGKKEYLQWWGKADILIDDNPEHIDAARHMGLKVFLVKHPWNREGMTVTAMLEELKLLSTHNVRME